MGPSPGSTALIWWCCTCPAAPRSSGDAAHVWQGHAGPAMLHMSGSATHLVVLHISGGAMLVPWSMHPWRKSHCSLLLAGPLQQPTRSHHVFPDSCLTAQHSQGAPSCPRWALGTHRVGGEDSPCPAPGPCQPHVLRGCLSAASAPGCLHGHTPAPTSRELSHRRVLLAEELPGWCPQPRH